MSLGRRISYSFDIGVGHIVILGVASVVWSIVITDRVRISIRRANRKGWEAIAISFISKNIMGVFRVYNPHRNAHLRETPTIG